MFNTLLILNKESTNFYKRRQPSQNKNSTIWILIETIYETLILNK